MMPRFLRRFNQTSYLHPFKNRSNTLATTDTHGDQCVTAANSLQLIKRLYRNEGAGCTDRMAECYRTAVWIGFVVVELQTFAHGQSLGCERLIGLDDVNVADLESSALQSQLRCRDRSLAH